MDMDSFNKWIRQRMGIPYNAKSDFNFEIAFAKTDWKDAAPTEIEISIDDTTPKIFIMTDEGLFYKGRRVILYIRDQVQYFADDGTTKTSEYKFHITGCATLKSMFNQCRYEKYVVSESTTGKFKINRIVNNIPQEFEAELRVCKHCLRALNWKDYKNNPILQTDIYENFSIKEFFESVNNDNQRNFYVMPKYTDKTAPLNVYGENWSVISKQLRIESNFICSECHKQFYNLKNLHVHHINGIKSDCRRSNLEVLCVDCHQRKHSHKILGSSR